MSIFSFPTAMATKFFRAWRWQRGHLLLILVLLVLAWGLRFYNLSGALLFQSDQGRDAMLVTRMLKTWRPVFIGPVTSIGNMYLGPFYYYFMVPWLALSYPSPLGPAIGVAITNVVLVALIYYWGRAVVGRTAAAWAAIFLTFSQVAIQYSRFSWNPNLSAFFSLALLYSIYLSLKQAPKYWWLVALNAGILMQLHYVNLIMVAVAGLAWLYQWWSKRRARVWLSQEKFYRWTLIAGVVFLLTLVPLTLFDLRHGGTNLKAMASIFNQEQGFTPRAGGEVGEVLAGVTGKVGHLFGSLLLPNLENLNEVLPSLYWYRVGLGALLIGLFLLVAYLNRRRVQAVGLVLLGTSAVIALLALAAYQHTVFDHYVLFFLPILFLIVGYLIAQLKRWRWLYYPACLLVVGVFGWGNYKSELYATLGHSYFDAWQVAREVATSVPHDKTYTFVSITQGQDTRGDYYRFFLEGLSANILSLEQASSVDYLYVIDETKQADLSTDPTYDIVIARNEPEATLEAVPIPSSWVVVSRFKRGRD